MSTPDDDAEARAAALLYGDTSRSTEPRPLPAALQPPRPPVVRAEPRPLSAVRLTPRGRAKLAAEALSVLRRAASDETAGWGLRVGAAVSVLEHLSWLQEPAPVVEGDTALGAQEAGLRQLRALVDSPVLAPGERADAAAALAKLASDAITQRELVDRLRAVEGGTLPAPTTGGT